MTQPLRVSVKDPATFKKYKLPLLYNVVMDMVKLEFEKDHPDCRGVALTTDCWTPKAEDPFISLIIHYISKEFKLKNSSSTLIILLEGTPPT